MKNRFWILGICAALCVTGCHTVYNVHRASPDDLSSEGSIVFVRPPHYHLFGTESYRDYTEITHEKAARNSAGMLKVDVGFRNRGGQHWWDTRGRDFSLSVKTAFYDQPFASGGQSSVPVYETNWQTLALPRGVTVEYSALCPKKSAGYYQVTVSEVLQ